MDMNKEACHCRNITYKKIQDAIKGGARSVEEVQKVTGFGTGCGKCREFTEYLIKAFLADME